MVYDKSWQIFNVQFECLCVIYWLSTKLSIKRCTCVNEWRNGRSRWAWDNYITRCHRQLESVGVGVSWRQDAKLRASSRQRALGLQWPTVEQPSQDEIKVLLGQYSSLSLSPLTSHTHETSTLSRIKCERYIFIKKCIHSFIEVVIIVDYVPHIFVYVLCCCMWLYNMLAVM